MKRYVVIVDEGDSGLDFEAILDIGMEGCAAEDQGFVIEDVVLEEVI